MIPWEVCDPAVDSEAWIEVEATDTRGAARAFLVKQGYRERDFDPARPFILRVRGGDASTRGLVYSVEVRVVPARFEVR